MSLLVHKKNNKNLFIIAGEVSGDLHGALLIDSIRKIAPEMKIFAIGGERMKSQGVNFLMESSGWGVIGFKEAFGKISFIKKKIDIIKEHIIKILPDLIIFIDSPAINMRIAEFAQKKDIPTFYYFPPSAWSRNINKFKKISKIIDNIVCTFEYSYSMFRKVDKSSRISYFGHPIIDLINTLPEREQILNKLGLSPDKKYICLMPGSRKQEVMTLLPVFLEVARKLLIKNKDLHFIIPIASTQLEEIINNELKNNDFSCSVVLHSSLLALKISDFAILASGTASLEAACLEIPHVIAYKLSNFDWWYAKKVLKIPFAGLPNLLVNKMIVPEFIQGKSTSGFIYKEVSEFLDSSEKYNNIKKEFVNMKNILGNGPVVEKVAEKAVNAVANCQRDVVIITNSPGELFSWVKVTTERIKRQDPNLRITVMLVPCPYASGKEEEIASGFSSIDIVLNPKDFALFMFGVSTGKYTPSPKGLVIFLGGDPWHALMVSRRLNFPCMGYLVRYTLWSKYFDTLAVTNVTLKNLLVKKGVKEEKIHVIGNLMVDGITPSRNEEQFVIEKNIDKEKMRLVFLPGSRYYHVQESLPVFLRVAEEVAENLDNVQFFIGLSPFLTVKDFSSCLKSFSKSGIRGSKGEVFENSKGNKYVKTEKDVELMLIEGAQYDLMNIADLVITIPGTNTAETAFLSKPMIVGSTPWAKIPQGGLLWLLSCIPTTKSVREWFMLQTLKRFKYTALPNQLAGEMIVPEVVVRKSASEISDIAIEVLQNELWRKKMSLALKQVVGPPGAKDKMVEIILNKI